MRKLIVPACMALSALSLTGCVLAPQTIALNEQVQVEGRTLTARDALVRVVDQRELGTDVLGHRGGRAPEYSPLLSDKPLADALTSRMQSTLAQLGFGAGTDQEPLKVQLTVESFAFSCNEGFIVNECSVAMRFLVTVMDGNSRFSKPFGINEMRSLAASPVAEYNEKWVNDVLDKLWMYMFNDHELKQALGL